MGSWVSCFLPKSLGVPHPDSAEVQSQVSHNFRSPLEVMRCKQSSVGQAYTSNAARSFQAFQGQGIPLLAMRQANMSRAPECDDADSDAAGSDERRRLLAAAASRRFDSKSEESVSTT
mmetsp:Transcript_77223/g.208479  ORF Transcript_77223/g.208479 Transcript_77223/m.208479 type:complete len:118 (+) Transcript_77223:439-792(+)